MPASGGWERLGEGEHWDVGLLPINYLLHCGQALLHTQGTPVSYVLVGEKSRNSLYSSIQEANSRKTTLSDKQGRQG